MKNSTKIKTILKSCCELSPSYLVVTVIGSLLSMVSLVGNVVIPKYLIEELVRLIQNKSFLIDMSNFQLTTYFSAFEKLFLIAIAFIGFNLLMSFILKTYQRFNEVKIREMYFRFPSLLARKIMEVPYQYLEDPYYLDLLERALFAERNQGAFRGIITYGADIVKNVVTILSLIVLVMLLSPILLIIVVVIAGLYMIVYQAFRKYQVKFYQNLIPINRKYGYYINNCYEPKIAKDIRLYQGANLISSKVYDYNCKIMDEFDIFYRRMGFLGGYMNVSNAIQTALVYGYVAFRVAGKWGSKITIGDFSMYTSGTMQLSQSIASLVENIEQFLMVLDFLTPYVEYMSLPEEKLNDYKYQFEGSVESIRFENVSFKYPKTEKEVLKDISFEIKKGEKISIVGLNGAGKTTLIKLICRLYHPTSGTIYINGHDIFDYEYRSYNQVISAVFQDFRLLAYSIEENITGKTEGADLEKVNKIIDQVGLREKIDELPRGLKTTLNKEYDEKAVELSGGQFQKVAIARALYKDSSLVILDEPTSALDPMAEADIYQNFNSLVKDKTAIYISHRMSSSVFCDKVLIIDGGTVSDFDSHEELMKKTDSLYYKMFHAQAKNYQI